MQYWSTLSEERNFVLAMTFWLDTFMVPFPAVMILVNRENTLR